MKTIKILSAALVAIATASLFQACSKDDDKDTNGDEKTINQQTDQEKKTTENGTSDVTYTYYVSQGVKDYYDLTLTYTDANGSEAQKKVTGSELKQYKFAGDNYLYTYEIPVKAMKLNASNSTAIVAKVTLNRNSNTSYPSGEAGTEKVPIVILGNFTATNATATGLSAPSNWSKISNDVASWEETLAGLNGKTFPCLAATITYLNGHSASTDAMLEANLGTISTLLSI